MHDWKFPFAVPGRWEGKKRIPPTTEMRMTWVDVDAYDDTRIEPRFVKSPASLEEFRAYVAEFADDVGVVPIDHPALAHEFDEIRYVYPHARSLVVLICEENKAAMQSRYLPTANHELYESEERLFKWNHDVIRYVQSLGGAGLSTTVGWPQEVSVRWADKIWPLSHKLVAQAAGLGVIGTSRNFLHRKYGAYCLIDTVVTNLEFEESEYSAAAEAREWNPCLSCNLCVVSCPTEAIKADGEFDFMACYNHTYRDSIPGFLDFARDAAQGSHKRFERRWSDAELAALWQSMAFRVEYRCFNCVATCPAEIHDAFHGDQAARQDYFDEHLKPLTHTRKVVEEQFVIDTPSAREKYDIAPGNDRSEHDTKKPGNQGMVRLVQLQRLRVSNIDSMMRTMPYYFRSTEAAGMDFTCQFEFTGAGGGEWVLRVVDQRCNVIPGRATEADLTVKCDGTLFLGIHRGSVNPLKELLLGRLTLSGRRELFLEFPKIFPTGDPDSLMAKAKWYYEKIRRSWIGEKRDSH
jgi:epoxyqueuosine reductase QueG/putative sterol carrier protein